MFLDEGGEPNIDYDFLVYALVERLGNDRVTDLKIDQVSLHRVSLYPMRRLLKHHL